MARGRRRQISVLLVALLVLPALLAGPTPPVAAQQPAPPTISLSPDCTFPWGDDVGMPPIGIRVEGHNFEPRQQLEIWHWNFDVDNPQPLARPETDDYGTFVADVTIIQPIFANTYRVWAARPNDRSPLAEAPFHVPCQPTIELSPPCGDPALVGQADHTVGVTGRDWGQDGFPVNARFVTFDGQTLDTARALVENGGFQMSLRPGALADGVYAVVVEDAGVIRGTEGRTVIALFAVPCRQLEIAPNPLCAPAGPPEQRGDILLTIRNLVPDSQVGGVGRAPITFLEIIIDAHGQREEFSHSAIVPDSGELGPMTINARQRPDGRYTVRVRQWWQPPPGTVAIPPYLLAEGTAMLEVPCPSPTEPTVTLVPDCGPPAFEGDGPRNYQITVSGSGFRPGRVFIAFDAIGDPELGTNGYEADVGQDGQFSRLIDPPRRPVLLEGYQVHVTQSDADPPIVVDTPRFRVPCQLVQPLIELRCAPDDPAPGGPTELFVDARGFFDQAPLVLTIGGSEPLNVTTDAAGNHSLRMPADDLPEGLLEVSGVQRDVRLVVLAEARANLLLPCGTPEEPLLRVLPETTPPGFVVTVEGIFFPAGEELNLRWSQGITAGQLIPVTPDADGIFRVQVLILHRDFLGEREVVAERLDDPAQAYAEPASLLVVPGRGSPPAFVPEAGLTFDPEALIIIRR